MKLLPITGCDDSRSWRTPTIIALAPTTLMLITLLVHAQQPANPPEVKTREAPPSFQIRVERNLVTVRVVVRDPKGRTVGNLTQSDFRLLDDGKPQEISSFTVETSGERSAGAAPAPAPAQPGAAPPQAAVPPQHFVGLFFDDVHLPIGDVQRTQKAAWDYIVTGMGPEDRVALFTASHQNDLDFTDDRTQLHDAIFRVRARSRTLAPLSECPSIGEYQAYLMVMDPQRNAQAMQIAFSEAYYCDCVRENNETPACATGAENRVKVEAAHIWSMADLQSQIALECIAASIRRLAAMAGQRTLVLVSPGFLTMTRSAEIESLIHNALRLDVVISAIDAGGLAPYIPQETADLSNAPLAMQKNLIYQEGDTVSRDVLANLSEGTGGVFFHNNNDFGAAFRETAAAPEVAYVLGFSPVDFKLDGKFHTLKVTLNRREPWSIEARRGYFDPTQTLAQQAPGQDELDKLMFSEDEIHALPVEVSAEVGKQVKPPSTLTVVIHVDTRNLQFRKEADRSVNTLTFDTALFDHDGKYVSGKEQSFEMHLTDGTLRKFERTGIYLKTSFQAPPGTYRIREVVRDVVAREISALNCEALIPGAEDSAAAAGKPSRTERVLSAPQSMANWTPAQFIEAMPELHGLEPAASQDELPLILERVGANVRAFFNTLPDITAHEEIILQRLDWASRPIDTVREGFNYLDLSLPAKDGIGLEEYRTNRRGKRVEPKPLEGGFVTRGFTSMLVHFHPIYQPDSTFRYLGRQVTRDRQSDVVYFAQIPEKARIKEALNTDERSILILVQGLAWIDPVSYQIVRMRTDVLFPLDDPYLRQETTDSQFAAVRFPGDAQPMWLPADVAVTVGWNRQSFLNDHHYSNFKLFRVLTQTQAMSPQNNPNRP